MLLQSFTSRICQLFCAALVLTTTTVCAASNPAYNANDTNTTASQESEAEGERLPTGTRPRSTQDILTVEALRARNAQTAAPEEKKSEASEMVAKGHYYTTHLGAFHNAKKIDAFLGQVTIEDGSVWSASFSDSYKLYNWFKSDDLVIMPNSPFSFYKYRIVNQDTLVSVDVNIILTPYLNGFATYRIVAVDTFFDKVWLSDGSVWEMTPFDSYVLKTWVPGDIVIIGINDDYLHDLRPNVLINAYTTDYVRGTCLY